MYAEYLKSKHGIISRNAKFLLEIGIPTLSLSLLIIVTIYVTVQAIVVLSSPAEEDEVIIYFLYGFSIANVFLDIFCSLLFYIRGKESILYSHTCSHHNSTNILLPSSPQQSNEILESHLIKSTEDTSQDSVTLINLHNPIFQSDSENLLISNKNLNMISAFAHVFGDTIRTFAVLIAAIISNVTGIRGDICDAWAAVVVAISILSIALPLIYEIVMSCHRFKQSGSFSSST